jgi:hypothetical protein
MPEAGPQKGCGTEGGNEVKYAVGDIVRIRSKEWIDAQEKTNEGDIKIDGHNSFAVPMFEYAGRTARITEVCGNCYKLNVDSGAWDWQDWMLEPDCAPAGEPLSAIDAIIAMARDGLVLFNEKGVPCRYDEELQSIVSREADGEKCIVTTFRNLRRDPPERKRPMTRWEMLDWAGSEESRGWLVRPEGGETWYLPQFYNYSPDRAKYFRARMLPDKSGIDESTIQGFEVEE